MKRPLRRVAAALSMTAALLVCVFLVWRRMPTGGDVPMHAPEERRRVFNRAGFSVVCPEHWTSRVQQGAPGLLFPEIILRSQRGELIWEIIELPDRPVLDASFRRIQFQEREAWMKETVVPRVVLDRPQETTTDIVFQRGDRWYSMVLATYGEYEKMPPILWKYFDTFSATRYNNAREEHGRRATMEGVRSKYSSRLRNIDTHTFFD